jgi:hypothetical protein
MQVLRLATLALLAVCATSGCRTAGVDELARPGPPLASNTANVAAILAEHNRNAERIQVLRASPDMTVTIKDRERLKGDSTAGLSGKMAMEQPRNFKLELNHTGAKVGDLGSNETEYWFWIKPFDKKSQRALYYCNYDEAEANAQAVTFQPDWIKEAMGLRVIPEDEAGDITVTSGEPGRLVLTHRPHKSSGKTYTRVTILDRATHQILEHRLLGGDQKTILARAEVPQGYKSYPASESGDSDETVLIPKRLKLYWVQEGLELDVVFQDVKINQPLSQSMREVLFVEPPLAKGVARINLAERPPGTAASSTTTIRETRPAPPSGVRLRQPTAIDGSEAARDTSRSPLALSGEGPMVPSLTEGVIGARYPAAAEPDYLKPDNSSSGWRAATSPGRVPQ